MSRTAEQLVTGEAVFRAEAGSHLAALRPPLGADYFVVGVIGSQSSGKSTLLNALFGTAFGVMDAQSQRRQTTRGIWMAALPERALVVLDIEGADSRERWQDKKAVEKKTALFGLVVSNLLIVNLWLAEIGRFSAANYDIIKLILEMNLLHFRRDAPKRLLFVVRDFTAEENFEHIAGLLRADVRRLWAEVKKPRGCEDLDFADALGVEVVALRHYVYLREGFEEDVRALGRRFDPAAPDHLLAGYTFRNVPGDALFPFMRQIWEAIAANKDINIPNEKVVVSAFRCNEIRAETLEGLAGELLAAERTLGEDRGSSANVLYRAAAERCLALYDRKTQHYDHTVVAEGRAQLAREISARFAALLDAEDERVAARLLEQFRADLHALTSGDFELKNAVRTVAVRKSTATQVYAEFLEESDRDSALRAERARLFALQLSKLVGACLAASSNHVLLGWRKAFCARVDALVHQTLRALTAQSWRAFNDELAALLADYVRRVGELGQGAEEARQLFSEELVAAQEAELLQWVKDELRKRRGLIAHALSEGFKAGFQLTESGARRGWKALEDAEIDKLFARARRRLQPTLDFLSAAVVLELDNDDVLKKEEAARLREGFEAVAGSLLESAYNEKYNRTALQRVPGWLWVLLLYFMHDNVLVWARNPQFFFLAGFGAVIVSALYFTGLHADVLAKSDELFGRLHDVYAEAISRVPATSIAQEGSAGRERKPPGRSYE